MDQVGTFQLFSFFLKIIFNGGLVIRGTCFNCVLKIYFCLKYWVEKLPLNIEGV